MNRKNYKYLFVIILSVFVTASLLACSVSTSMIKSSKRFERKFDKTLIIKPYTPARERDRVSVGLKMKEFTKGDEDSFHRAVFSSLKSSNLFKRVVSSESVEDAESTKGNAYMYISNNVASYWVDEKNIVNARFNTTVSIAVKNKIYFRKVYDETDTQGLFGPNLKIALMSRVISQLLEDLSLLEFPDKA